MLLWSTKLILQFEVENNKENIIDRYINEFSCLWGYEIGGYLKNTKQNATI